MADNQVQGISGIGIAALFAGGILAWSAVKGYTISTIARDLIAGKDPSKDPAAAQGALTVTPTGLLGGLFSGVPIIGGLLGNSGSSSGSGSSTTVTAGPGMTAFAKAVLGGIGAPTTQANINSIIAWAHREGGGGANNPLNTTLDMPGATDFNSVGVKNFGSASIGATATVRTILGGGYSDVLAALKSGNGLCGQSFSGLSRWSGGGYSSVC
jgi:hypothetical protein